MLNIELLIAIASFAFITSVTPGPNNIMLTASGANFGVMRTLPHIAGIVFGIALMNLLIGLGLGAVFQQYPVIQKLLKIGGSAYLIWLAVKLLRFSHVENSGDSEGRPFSFLQAASFQYINPKAWVMVISANASFTLSGDLYWTSVGLIIGLFILIGPPSVMVWTIFGQVIRRHLRNPAFLRGFNTFMASLTAMCIFFIWID
ncbi:MAG: LysE family translocator [Gammaproteobacteria bacterium]|nr:MAG: LysE family translocator [Gammaproteobacteria bacterium]